MTRILKLFITIFFLTAILPFPPARAADTATLFFAGTQTAHIGQTVHVRALLSTPVAINVVQGTITYPSDKVTVQSMSTGKSILRYWQQNPEVRNSNTIQFVGGLPTPGFTGKNGQLVDIAFTATAVGTAVINFEGNSEVLANDGNGTTVPVVRGAFELTISKTPPTTGTKVTPTPTPVGDTTPPTNLELIIGRDSYLFDGDWFAVFQAVDSESGIDHYEIAETNLGQTEPDTSTWKVATSPYRLENQVSSETVFLKAVDKSGNSAIISRSTHIAVRTTPWWLALLVELCTVLFIAYILFMHREREDTTPFIETTVQN